MRPLYSYVRDGRYQDRGSHSNAADVSQKQLPRDVVHWSIYIMYSGCKLIPPDIYLRWVFALISGRERARSHEWQPSRLGPPRISCCLSAASSSLLKRKQSLPFNHKQEYVNNVKESHFCFGINRFLFISFSCLWNNTFEKIIFIYLIYEDEKFVFKKRFHIYKIHLILQRMASKMTLERISTLLDHIISRIRKLWYHRWPAFFINISARVQRRYVYIFYGLYNKSARNQLVIFLM